MTSPPPLADELAHRLSTQTDTLAKLIEKTETKLQQEQRNEQQERFRKLLDVLGQITAQNNELKNIVVTIEQERQEQILLQSEAHSGADEWQAIQIEYVASFLEKCISRMNMHEEAVRHYTRRHYYITIPATTLGVISSTAAFTQWTDEVFCGEVSWVWILVGLLMALTTLLHNLSENIFAFKDKARQHRTSYIDFNRLVKRVGNELNNPDTEHRPYRQFIESISEDYDRYTEKALVIPERVDKMLRERWIANRQREQDKLLRQNRNDCDENSKKSAAAYDNEQQIVSNTGISTAIDAACAAKEVVTSDTQQDQSEAPEHGAYTDEAERIRKSIAAFQEQRNQIYANNERHVQFQTNRNLVDYCKTNNSLRPKTSRAESDQYSALHPAASFHFARPRSAVFTPRQVKSNLKNKTHNNDLSCDSLLELNMLTTTSTPTDSSDAKRVSSPDTDCSTIGGGGGHDKRKERPRVRRKKSKPVGSAARRDSKQKEAPPPVPKLPTLSIVKQSEDDEFASTPDDMASIVSGQVTFDGDNNLV